MDVSSLGSPIGKVQVVGRRGRARKNVYCRIEEVSGRRRGKGVRSGPRLRDEADSGLFLFPPWGSDPKDHLSQAVDSVGPIAEMCHRSDLTFGLEIERTSWAATAFCLAEIHRQVNHHPGMVLVLRCREHFGARLRLGQVFAQYLAMKPGLGWMHIKDYRSPQPISRAATSMRTPWPFRPRRPGRQRPRRDLRDFARTLPALGEEARPAGIPGGVLGTSTHLKGGGSSAASAGPTAMGVALRGLSRSWI